jgi:hypothetical protein
MLPQSEFLGPRNSHTQLKGVVVLRRVTFVGLRANTAVGFSGEWVENKREMEFLGYEDELAHRSKSTEGDSPETGVFPVGMGMLISSKAPPEADVILKFAEFEA